MKKAVSIFFLLIYGLTAVSATVHMHYCMNKLIGAGFSHAKSSLCEKCGMQKGKANGCCKDEHKQVQLNREHQQAGAGLVMPDISAAEIHTSFVSYLHIPYPAISDIISLRYVPPAVSGRPQYIFHCVFRI